MSIDRSINFEKETWIRDLMVDRALYFMIGAHEGVGQKVKWTGAPYHTHPKAVHQLLLIFHSTFNVDISWEQECAALLHDVVEDTKVSLATIERFFGPKVCELVDWLTDVAKPEDGNRATRMAINRAHSAKATVEAKVVKIADLCCNTSSIVKDNIGFARTYVPEKRLILEEAMLDLPPVLLEYAWNCVRAAEHALVQADLEQKEARSK